MHHASLLVNYQKSTSVQCKSSQYRSGRDPGVITGLALLAGAYLVVCEDVQAAVVEELFDPIASILVRALAFAFLRVTIRLRESAGEFTCTGRNASW